jgi:hypothetical protein
MNLDEFRKSLTAAEPPPALTLALGGLWWDAKGDWKRAQARKEAGEKILLSVIPSRTEHVKLSL